MTSVHLYVHGRGRGHGQRSKAVSDHLREAGFELRIFAGRDALEAFAPGEAEPVDSLMPGEGWRGASALRRRVSDATQALRADRPAAVLSDGDLPGVLAARMEHLPSVALGHGLVFSHTQRPACLPVTPWLRQGAKARLASLGTQRQVAVSFAPLTPKTQTTLVARPTLRRALTGKRTPDDHLLCYFRDANAAHVLRALSDDGLDVRLFSEVDPNLPGVHCEPPHPERFSDALMSARAVISSAGSQLISECVALGIPQLPLYDEHDDEQRLNVGLLRAHGLGAGCALTQLDRTTLMSFLGQLHETPCRPIPRPWGPDAAQAVQGALDSLVTRFE